MKKISYINGIKTVVFDGMFILLAILEIAVIIAAFFDTIVILLLVPISIFCFGLIIPAFYNELRKVAMYKKFYSLQCLGFDEISDIRTKLISPITTLFDKFLGYLRLQ